jgi:hypothetical protein
MIQVAGLMIAAELAQRCFVELRENIAQFLGVRITGSKTLSVNLTQRADEGVSVLVADFTVVVAVAIVETCFAHAALLVPQATASSRRDRMAILRRNTSGRDLLNHPARLGRPTFPALAGKEGSAEKPQNSIRQILADALSCVIASSQHGREPVKDPISQPYITAKKEIEQRKKTRDGIQAQFQSAIALETIADELTRLVAEARTIRYLFATYAARR